MTNSARIVRLAMAMAVPGVGASQNLVPNGSFEDYTSCPSDWGQIDRATGWYWPFYTSPDFFHTCASPLEHSDVPQNAAGYQEPFEGQGYGGVITYFAPGTIPESNLRKEVMAIALTAPLQPGSIVLASMMVAVGGDGNQIGSSGRLTTNGIGMRFSTVPSYDPFVGLPNATVAHLASVPTDTVAWMSVNSTFIVDSAYTHIMIGNFYDDSLLNPQVIFTMNDIETAYMFVDAVCVTYGEPCDFVGVDPLEFEHGFRVFPNPFSDLLSVQFDRARGGQRSVELMDALGRLCHQASLPTNHSTIDFRTSGLPEGQYILRISIGQRVMLRRVTRMCSTNF